MDPLQRDYKNSRRVKDGGSNMDKKWIIAVIIAVMVFLPVFQSQNL